jgi:type VI secretion system ImpM family protein
MSNEHHWKWFTWGKHPALEDFVWAGTQTPLFQRFTKWVDNGFAGFKEDSKLRTRNCSWRFWTRGTGTEVVCGLVRNSCDTHGRNFPLLCIGTGGLTDWPGNCSLLPLAFESMWKNVEYVASARFDTTRQLNESLQLIEKPIPDWHGYQRRIHITANTSKPMKCDETVVDGKRLLQINCGQPENLPLDMQFCRRVTAMAEDQSPMAVFIGEIQDNIAVAIINHALVTDDFLWLWDLNQERRIPAKQLEQEG